MPKPKPKRVAKPPPAGKPAAAAAAVAPAAKRRRSSSASSSASSASGSSPATSPPAPDQPAAASEAATAAPEPVLVPGSVVLCRVDRASERDLTVMCKIGGGLEKRILACIDVTHIQDAFTDPAPMSALAPGQFVKARVLLASPFARTKLPSLSTRASLVSGERSVAEELASASALPREGELVTGYVQQTNSKGCFVRLSRLVVARVELRNLADGFVESPSKAFPPGKLVAGRVVNADEAGRRVELSLRRSVVLGESEQKWALSTLQPGEKLDGVVRNVETFGVFVNISSSQQLDAGGGGNGLVGLCHISQVSDHDPAPLLTRVFSPGDVVRCVVLKVDVAKQRLSLGLKPSYFAGDDAGARDDGEMEGAVQRSQPPLEQQQRQEELELEQEPGMSLQDALRLAGVASATAASAAEDEGDAYPAAALLPADADAAERRKNKLNPKRREAHRERQLVETRDMEARLASDAPPESVEDFERALVAQPNSSLLYIQLISLLVSLTELDKARAVGERALRVISFREEGEKANVWRALLVMEIEYGSEESTAELFGRMLKETDPKWAYLALCDAHAARGASAESQGLAEAALRGAKKATKQQSLKVWMRHVELKFEWDQAAAGRALLKDALKNVPARKHLKAMLRLARLEFEHARGDKERARALLEACVANYPKRTDVWHVFVDFEVKYGDVAQARQLLERVVNVKMSVKKAKAFFKKWLAFEAEHGDDAGQERVKALARAFVERL